MGSMSGGLRGQVSGLPGQKEEALVFWTTDGRGWWIGLRRLALDGSEEYMIISQDRDLKDMGSPFPSSSSAIPKPKTSARECPRSLGRCFVSQADICWHRSSLKQAASVSLVFI